MNESLFYSKKTSPRSQSSHPHEIASQLGMLGGQVKAPRRAGAVPQRPRAKKGRTAWRLGNLAQICDTEFVCEVLDASEEMLATRNADGDTPGNQSASGPGVALGPGGPQIHRWTWQPARLIVWLKFMF